MYQNQFVVQWTQTVWDVLGKMQPFIKAQIKQNFKASRHWPSLGGSTSDFPHKWPVTRKMFPLYDAIRKQDNTVLMAIVIAVGAGDLWPPLLTWINFNRGMDMKSHAQYSVDEITYLFRNFNGATVEV